MIPVVLASQSPARRNVLTAAGITPHVLISAVDEKAIEAEFTGPVGDLTVTLAEAKARAVIERLSAGPPVELTVALGQSDTVLVLAADSLLEYEGTAIGKPGTAEATRAVWSRIASRWTMLHSGHAVAVLDSYGSKGSPARELRLRELRTAHAQTAVLIGSPSEAELEAYIATEEPFHVAGALTIDGYGGAFVDRLDGDHLTVLGLSLPVVRDLITRMGLFWPDLWDRREA